MWNIIIPPDVLNTEEDLKMLHYEIYNDKSIKYKGSICGSYC